MEPEVPGAATRAAYLALNDERCRRGHRRACAAVTCERSGDLASRECQAAVGFHAGRGWQARPRGDVFDPALDADDYVLRCTTTGRTHRFRLQRTSAVVPSATGRAPVVTLDTLPSYASAACAAHPDVGSGTRSNGG